MARGSSPVRRFGIPDGDATAGEGLEREGLLSGRVTGLGGEGCGESEAGSWKEEKEQLLSWGRRREHPAISVSKHSGEQSDLAPALASYLGRHSTPVSFHGPRLSLLWTTVTILFFFFLK